MLPLFGDDVIMHARDHIFMFCRDDASVVWPISLKRSYTMHLRCEQVGFQLQISTGLGPYQNIFIRFDFVQRRVAVLFDDVHVLHVFNLTNKVDDNHQVSIEFGYDDCSLSCTVSGTVLFDRLTICPHVTSSVEQSISLVLRLCGKHTPTIFATVVEKK